MISPKTSDVNCTVVFPEYFYYDLVFRELHGEFVKLLFVSFSICLTQ